MPIGAMGTAGQQVFRLVRRLRERHNSSIVFISHNLGTVVRICDRIGVMYAGELVEEGTHEELAEGTGTYAALYQSWLGNVRELVNFATRYDFAKSPEGIEQLLEEAALQSDQDQFGGVGVRTECLRTKREILRRDLRVLVEDRAKAGLRRSHRLRRHREVVGALGPAAERP